MASSTIEKKMRTFVVSDGVVTSTGSATVYSANISTSDTVRRGRPADLFANATPRSNSTSETRYFAVNYPLTLDGKTRSSTSTIATGGAIGLEDLSPYHNAVVHDISMKLRNKMKDQKVNLALSIKEGGQSISMINSLFVDALSTYRNLRKKGLPALLSYKQSKLTSRFTAEQKRLANRWLEYQYGVKPIISDIYGLAYMASEQSRIGRWMYVRASSETSDNISRTYYNGSLTMLVKSSVEVKGNGVARYRISSEAVKGMSELGFTNIPTLLWEATPYSFVFDAIYDVGSFLHGLDATFGTSGLSWLWSRTSSVSSTRATVAGGINTAANLSYREWSRSGLNSAIPLGSPQWNSKAPSITRLANYLSLIRQLR